MNRLEDINGQQAVIDKVLAERDPRKEVFVAVGPLGSGTTWTLNRCAELWEAEEGAALEVRGETFASDRRLFPWLTMALPRAKRLARLEVLKGSLAQGTRAVPVVGSVTSYLVEEVLNYDKRRLAREALLLTDQEQDLLYVIQTTAQNKQLLLTIDHLESWDEASWSLLALILSPKLDELYPALADAVILVGACREVPSRLHSILSSVRLTELPIRLLDREEMPIALSAFEFPNLSPDDTDRLYEITNGRLDLIHDVSQHFREVDLAGLSSGWTDFYTKLVKRRVQSLEEQIKDLEGTLTAAAVIGNIFTLNDIACLTGSAIDAVTATLRLAAAEHFVSSVGDVARFASTELHRYFHRTGMNEHARYHAKFAECLRTMRPGDYGHRVHHLLLAGNIEDALTCYAHAALAARRDYSSPPDPGDLDAASGWSEIRLYLDKMMKAFDAYDDQQLNDGLAILDEVEAFLPEALIAERDYLEAQFLLAAPSVSSYDRARLLLERWSKLAGREGELWARMAQSLIVAQAQTGHLDEARRLEAELTGSYWGRRHVDPWALHALNVLRRSSECLHSLPATTQRLENAISYFGPAAGGFLPRHPLQYYFTLTNLIGNRLASGRFADAGSKALELEELIRRYPSLPWPLPEIAANNSVLARYLADTLDAATASTLLTQVATGSIEAGDRILLQNNCAVLLVHNGKIQEARAAFEATYATVGFSKEPDEYHRYFISNNLAALFALSGDLDRAHELINECAAVVDKFYPAIHATMVRRQQLIGEAINEAPNLTPEEFDKFLIQRHGMQVGPQWAFYGRGFLLTDIQYWSIH